MYVRWGSTCVEAIRGSDGVVRAAAWSVGRPRIFKLKAWV